MLRRVLGYISGSAVIVVLTAATSLSAVYSGKVFDSLSGKPLAGAMVTVGKNVIQTDTDGTFNIAGEGDFVGVRAHGYLRENLPSGNIKGKIDVKLKPFKPKALYLSFYGIGSQALRNPALRLIEETELNSLVIDVKGDKGMVPYKSRLPLVMAVGAQKITTVKDMREMVDSLHSRGIYAIARIVVFKDNALIAVRPDFAIRTANGEVFKDNEDLAWCDPFREEVWEYNVNIAEEAARIGFDEIQFDYVRFPDKRGLKFSMPNTEENRVKAITGFLAKARKHLVRYNVFLSADIFGYVGWNTNDTEIGQRLEDMAQHLDYLAPMLYPSGFQFGIPGYRNPVANPREIVELTLVQMQKRTGLPPERFRPWLQAFRDYAFDGRQFGAKEIKDQIVASEDFGGWMLWNPRNVYDGDGLRREGLALNQVGVKNRKVNN